MRTRRSSSRNLANPAPAPAPAPDLPPQTSDQIFDDLQWSDLSFTREDMGEWSQIQMNTEDKKEEVKDAEAKDPLKEEEVKEAEAKDPVKDEEAENFITVPVELAIDVSFNFTTEKVFDSKEALIQWCQDVGRELNMVVTVVKNEKSYKGRRGSLVLGCERRGIDRTRRKSSAKRAKPRQNLGASKCNCPFELIGEAIDGDKWKLGVSCGVHNHELQEALAEDACDEEKKALVDVTAMPVEVVMSPERQDAESFSKAIVRVEDADGKDAMSFQDSQVCPQASGRDQLYERPPPYKHIERNEFLKRKHKKQKQEDICICECRYDADDPDSACGEECLNVLTSTECTPSRCPCGNYCKNQKFQKCENARTKLFKSEGRGWGLLAEENIKAGQFVIEYCGEVISCKEAKRRSQTYEAQGLKDAYIIYLDGNESIDATRKGSLARFINHSCQPNCETRKWMVLGEIRVGIFAKHDIPVGTELAYDYNFEWYGGAMVRCLCGSPGCSEFLGAKSRGFQEATYLWEDDDDRYSIENVPLYDSEDDEPLSKLLKTADSPNNIQMVEMEHNELVLSCSMPIVVDPLNSVLMEIDEVNNQQIEDTSMLTHDTEQNYTSISATASQIQINGACPIYQIESNPLSRISSDYTNGRSKNHARKQVNMKQDADHIISKEGREEILACQERKTQSATELALLYDEIQPAIVEHERDSQDNVDIAVAERWIFAHCDYLKKDFDYSCTYMRNTACPSRRAPDDIAGQGDDIYNDEVMQ